MRIGVHERRVGIAVTAARGARWTIERTREGRNAELWCTHCIGPAHEPTLELVCTGWAANDCRIPCRHAPEANTSTAARRLRYVLAVRASDRIVAFRQAVEARLARQTTDDPSAFASSLDDVERSFDLDERASAFVWACVVVAVDPMMYPHLIAVSGVDGRRGLTPAAYAALTGMAERDVMELAYWLSQTPSLVRFGLLERDVAEFLPIATPYRASARLVAHVVGGRASP
ncbi:MAG: hypothetical protein WKG01_10635 [Kofleriaceae bacterium]